MHYSFGKNRFQNTDYNPHKLAVITSDENLTWAELLERSNRLSGIFKSLHIPHGHPVIIYGHKESFFPVSMVAAMLSDLPYIPVDSSVPVKRLKKIKAMAGSQVILNCTKKSLPVKTAIEISADFTMVRNYSADFTDAVFGNDKDPIRYIIFTSGSTGAPKGVQITQSALISFSNWLASDFGFDENDVFVNQANLNFDLSVFELVAFLHFGATLLLTNNTIQQNMTEFNRQINNCKGSVMVVTPSFAFLCLRENQFTGETLKTLHTFLFCGEVLPAQTAKMLLSRFPKSRVLNTYGPTEATVATTLVNCTSEIIARYQPLPVGYPKSSSKVFIDENNENEIIIAGDNVSTGYIKNEAQNKEKFFTYKGKRAFRTGDYGYLKDGMLFFTGRKDDQIKFHGYRIELDEINAVIEQVSVVEKAVTIPLLRNNKVTRLIAFVVLKKATGGSYPELKNYIIDAVKDTIPDYMIPGDIVSIDKIPLTSNHKMDKAKLVEFYIAQKREQ